MIPRGRVLRAPDRAEPLLARGIRDVPRRRMAREELEARLTAERVLVDAGAAADALLADAQRRAELVVEKATREARDEASVELAAQWLALRHKERAALGSDSDRIVAMAVALAERLLGASLALDPTRIANLARGVLDETRGARRAVIEAHPLDADELQRQLVSGGLGELDPRAFEVRADEGLARGELRLHTDVGTIDARLASRFDRLAAALRDALADALADDIE